MTSIESPRNGDASGREQRFRFYSHDELRTIAQPQWLIRGLLPAEGMSLLFGDSNTGKGFLAVEVACRLALGQPFAGRETKRARVLYVTVEDGADTAPRLDAWVKEHNGGMLIPSDSLRLVLDGLSLRDPADFSAFLQGVLAYRPDLVIVDTLARTFGDGDENDGQDMGAYLDACERLRHDGEVSAVMLVHHSGKDTSKGPRGHSKLFASMTTVLLLKETDRNQGKVVLQVEKQKRGAKIDPIGLRRVQVQGLGCDENGQELTSCVLVPADGAAEKARVVSANHRSSLCALYALPGHSGKSGEWRKETGLVAKTFQNHRQALEREGLISSIGPAHYKVTDTGLALCA